MPLSYDRLITIRLESRLDLQLQPATMLCGVMIKLKIPARGTETHEYF